MFVIQRSDGAFVAPSGSRSSYTLASDGDKDDWKPALEWVWTVLGDEYGLPPALWPLPQTATV